MKGKRQVSPAVITSLVLVAMLMVVGVIGFVGRGGEGAASLVDDGPNASLSNEDLLSAAITNMKTLKTYAVEFEGLKPAGSASPKTHMTMSGHEVVGKGLKLAIRGERPEDLDAALKTWTILDAVVPLSTQYAEGMVPLPGRVDFIGTANETYYSMDGSKTWLQPAAGGDIGLVLLFYCGWGNMELSAAQWANGDLPPCGGWAGVAKFGDAQPRTETIDGVPTRHLTSDLMATWGASPQGEALPAGPIVTLERPEAMTLQVWASTDSTPRIRQMRVDVATKPGGNYSETEPTPPTNLTYSLTWKWSRFNEDLGEVEPPPADTVREP